MDENSISDEQIIQTHVEEIVVESETDRLVHRHNDSVLVHYRAENKINGNAGRYLLKNWLLE